MDQLNSRSPSPAPEPSGLERYGEVIAGEIVPRLLRSHRAGPVPPEVAQALGELSEAEVDDFVRLVREAGSEGQLEVFVDALLERGVTTEAVYLDLLAPAARRLGVMWETDECNFLEVTLSLGHLQQVLRRLSVGFLGGSRQDGIAGRALLGCASGEQHTLGLFMVAEFFVRDGWGVELGPPVGSDTLAKRVRRRWYDVVGISVACDSRIDVVSHEIGRIRRTSRNRSVRVLVGGRPFNADPGLVERVGADASAGDAREAPRIAAALM